MTLQHFETLERSTACNFPLRHREFVHVFHSREFDEFGFEPFDLVVLLVCFRALSHTWRDGSASPRAWLPRSVRVLGSRLPSRSLPHRARGSSRTRLRAPGGTRNSGRRPRQGGKRAAFRIARRPRQSTRESIGEAFPFMRHDGSSNKRRSRSERAHVDDLRGPFRFGDIFAPRCSRRPAIRRDVSTRSTPEGTHCFPVEVTVPRSFNSTNPVARSAREHTLRRVADELRFSSAGWSVGRSRIRTGAARPRTASLLLQAPSLCACCDRPCAQNWSTAIDANSRTMSRRLECSSRYVREPCALQPAMLRWRR